MKLKAVKKVARLALKYLTEDPSVDAGIQRQASVIVAELADLDEDVEDNAESIEQLMLANQALLLRVDRLEEQNAAMSDAVNGMAAQLVQVGEFIEAMAEDDDAAADAVAEEKAEFSIETEGGQA